MNILNKNDQFNSAFYKEDLLNVEMYALNLRE